MVIDGDMDNAVVKRDDLEHGFYEFEINRPARGFTFERSWTN